MSITLPQSPPQCQSHAIAGSARPSTFSWGTVLRAVALLRSRRALDNLSEEQLADIGISRADAETEAKRPIWDAPTSWKS